MDSKNRGTDDEAAGRINGDGASPEILADAEDRPRSNGRFPWATALSHVLATGWIGLVLIAMLGYFTLTSPVFLTQFNIINIFVSASILSIMGVGQTFVIITAGIDLSVGSVLVFSGVVAASVMYAIGGADASWVSVTIGIAAGVAAGTGVGIVNGALVARSRVPPLIVTLGTLGMSLGLAEEITGGVDLHNVPKRLVDTFGFGDVFGIPVLVVAAVVVAVIGSIVLSQTRFGRHTYAIGSNPEAARRAGLNVDRHLVEVYALQGLLAEIAGVLSLARFATTTIGGHTGDNLAVISGVVLGGTSLFGGYGSIPLTIVGILIPTILQDGLVILGVQPYWQTIAIGGILILAVYIDQLKRRSRARA